MLEYNENSQPTKILAMHYALQIDPNFLLQFMSGQADILSREQAVLVVNGFWEMTDLAVQDHHADKTIEDVMDIEFYMYKLFNKVNGYMTQNGFKDIWDASVTNR